MYPREKKKRSSSFVRVKCVKSGGVQVESLEFRTFFVHVKLDGSVFVYENVTANNPLVS